MSSRKLLSLGELEASFPKFGKFHNGPWAGQQRMLEFVAAHGSAIIESPTGSGKTAVEYAILQAACGKFDEPIYWIAPSRTIVEQHATEFPDVHVIYGQSEHPCPWAAENFEKEPKHPVTADQLPILYEDPKISRVDAIPYVMHRQCDHYVDQTTGKTQKPGVVPCPFYQQTYEAKQGGIVLCTMSYYLYVKLYEKRESGTPPCPTLVIDEAHRIADVVRYSLSYDITDWHLVQSIKLLKRMGSEVKADIRILRQFLRALRQIPKARKRPPYQEVLLEDDEIRRLMEILENLDSPELLSKIAAAVEEGVIDPREDLVVLKKLETLVQDIRRYLHSFAMSLAEYDEGGVKVRGPLDYTCAFYKEEKGEHDRVQYKLVVRAHYVSPLIARRLLAPFTVSFSATVGKPDIFGIETGIRDPVFNLAGTFPTTNTRLYMPTDTPNLAANKQSRQDLTRVLRRIARACVRFAKHGHRSLVVVISNAEREKFLTLAKEENLSAVSYGNGVAAKEIAMAFRAGNGDALVGTAAHYAEGIDLPRQSAPVIFFLRPGYPNPRDAGTQFEERKFGGARWGIWNWRVTMQALQVRGRNIRSRSDVGVCFFVSQQFRRVVYGGLPEWLEPAYRGALTFEAAVADAEKLLS